MVPNATINQHGTDRILAGHPWVFRSDIVSAEAAPGEIVTVLSPKRKPLGQALYNPRSKISLRMISRRQEPIDDKFWKERIERALALRDATRDATRLVFGEADGLPGLIVDRYQDLLVFQTLCLGIDRLKEKILTHLQELVFPSGIVERNDPPVRELEGLTKQKGIVAGGAPAGLTVSENDTVFVVDPLEGQKTGLYLDQQENRLAVGRYARGRVLDLFCYQGGFALHLAKKADEVLAVDASAEALQKLRENLERNRLENVLAVEANVFDYLRDLERRGEMFDTIILDPPPFVSGRQSLEGGRRGFKEINLRAMKLIRPGGILVTCSCSQNFSEPMFYEMLLDAAMDVHREVQVLERRGAAPDHPVLLTFPESHYLQCWILRVL